MKRSFDEWMREVDRAIARKAGLSALDLPDVPYRDWYEDGVRPASAAAKAIRNAKSEGY
jgi:hypothetical protein